MATSGSVTSGTAGSGGKSYFQVTWSRSSVSIPNNKSTISWTLKLIAGNYWYTNAVRIDYVKINGTTVKGSETYSNKIDNTYTLASGTLDIPHNSDGTKTFTIELSGWFYDYGTRTGSGSFTLDTIPRASTMSVPTFTAGTAGTFSISRASSSFTHTIQYKFGSIGWTDIVTKTSSTSISWTPPLSLLQQMTGAASKTETNGLRLATYSGNTLIGEKYYNLTIQAGSAAKPTVTGFTVSANPAVLGKYVQGKSRIQFAITGSGYQGSSIAGYEFQGAGETLNPSSGEGNTSILSSVPSDPTTLTLKGWVKDSRGKWSDASTQTIQVYKYSQPQVTSVNIRRVNSSGTDDEEGNRIAITCRANVGATVGGDNTLTVSYSIKNQATGSIVSSGTIAVSQSDTYNTIIDDAGVTNSYIVTVVFTDTVGSSITRTVMVPTARVTFHLKAGGTAAAFGKYAEGEKALELAPDWDLICHGGAMADHVIDQGTDERWTYRKWSSGVSECWGYFGFTGVNINTAWGGLYESEIKYLTFPSGLFAGGIGGCVISPQGGASFPGFGGGLSKSRSQGFWFMRPVAQTNGSYAVFCHAFGRWK